MVGWEKKEEFKSRVRNWAEKLNTQVRIVTIRPMKKKWASCSTVGNLTFDSELLSQGPKEWDYVIVHELVHLIEANHTPRFWNIVRAQAATTEKAKAWLKDNGQLLEEAI